ncbi:TRAP transporter substrate-binding protein DctP [Thermodesulfobacteriota bacterium]
MKMKLDSLPCSLCLLLILTIILLPVFAEQAPGKPIVLKAIGFLPKDNISVHGLILLRDKVNERAKGALKINIVGGPEAIPAFDQSSALKQGVVDLGYIPDGYFMKFVPETFALSLTQYNAPQERERGLVKFLQDKYSKAGIHYLGRGGGTIGFYLGTLKRVDTVAGLRGLKFPGSPIAVPAFKSLGMSMVDIEDAEIWSALDRGVIDGVIDPTTLIATFRWYDRLKYLIDHKFYNLHTAITMNLNSWNKLPKDLQDLLTDVMIEVEKEVTIFFAREEKTAYKKILDAGVKPIKFSPAGEKKFYNTVYGAFWGASKGRMSAESFSKMRQLLQ